MSFINKILNKFFGKKSDRDVKEIQPIVEQIKQMYEQLQSLSNDQLRQRSAELKQRIRESVASQQNSIAELRKQVESENVSYQDMEAIYADIDRLEKEIDQILADALNEALPEAFAIIKDTARRFSQTDELEVTANDFDRNLAATKTHIEIKGNSAIYKNQWMAGGNMIKWDMVHYDVQLIGGIVLHQGKIAEMATGEGKTLVATLPVFLNALSGRGVHLVTVNDYLAKRDSEWMGTLYEFHGLSVDCIDKHQPNTAERRKAYAADITFGTNNEFGFDYLRDNMTNSPEELVQRKHVYAIVDEVDSVLIDEARTPLIISGPVPKGDKQLFDELKPHVVRIYNEQKRLTNQLLSDAKKLIEKGDKEEGPFKLLQSFKGLPKNTALIKYLSEQGIKAQMLKTENIYLSDNSRRMHEVTDILYFVIDEKNNTVELTDRGIHELSSGNNEPNFFILPDIGTAIADIEKSQLAEQEKLQRKEELYNDYSIKSERLHTINQLLKAYTLFDRDVEYVVMDNKVKIVDEQTGRIMEGRRYSDGLHQAIEAKENVKIEAATQTFATITLQNYFRMYKKLSGMTGTAETEAGEFWNIYKLDVVVIPTNRAISRKDSQDLVYKTKREKYNAVIEEVVSLVKVGRPVLVGTTSVEISELLSKMLNMRGIKHNVLNAKQHQREAQVVLEAGRTGAVTIATNMAGRGTDIKLTPEVKAAGGLAIVGTERHESRRVDRQLRGRAGRQGDPGSSQFFVSLEDDLMRLFGSDRVIRMMDRFGLKEGESIQHSMVTGSIERAQKKVEENNFGIRKRLLEYDDVMNSQREVIYTRRRHALYGERISVDINNMMHDVCESIVSEGHGNLEYPDFQFEVIRHLGIEVPFGEKEYLAEDANRIIDRLYKQVRETYERKCRQLAVEAFPVFRNITQQRPDVTEVIVPLTDGLRIFQFPVNLKRTLETEGREVIKSMEQSLVLATIDMLWKEHLREMDELRHSVHNAVYEQKDPLLIYKLEAYQLFRKMLDRSNKQIVSMLVKAHIQRQDPNEVRQAAPRKPTDMSRLRTSKAEVSTQQSENAGAVTNQEQAPPQPFRRMEKKVGRNDLCPCGSGKKYKNCHGVNAAV